MKKVMKVANSNQELIEAIDELEKERGINKKYLLESLETALVTAYKRNFDYEENVKIAMDENTGVFHIYAVKEVVMKPENNMAQISKEEAVKIDIKEFSFLLDGYEIRRGKAFKEVTQREII